MAGFLGRGYDYPMRIAGDGKHAIVSGNEKVQADLYAVMDTPVGTRFMMRAFGNRVHELNFENDTEVVRSLAVYYTEEAIARWVPQIDLDNTSITCDMLAGEMVVAIRYQTIASNVEENLVYRLPVAS